MTREELVLRIRSAPGRSIHEKVNAVVATILDNPKELKAVWQVIGPWCLFELERRYVHRALPTAAAPRAIPVANTGHRKDPYEWRRADLLRLSVYYGKASQTLREASEVYARMAKHFENEEETLRDVRSRITPELWQTFCKVAKLKELAA